MRAWLAGALLIFAGAPAQGGANGAHDICDDLRLAVTAARADPPFSTLPPRVFQQGHLLFGIAWPCALEAAPRALRCRQYQTFAGQAERMAAETARCLAGAGRDADEGDNGEGRGRIPYYRARFHLPGLTIEIMRSGNPAHHLGQFITYRVARDRHR